jgi:peptidoglycan/LPS O-acetylase OafA/YrhL
MLIFGIVGVVAYYIANDMTAINMQKHKFPPTYLFTLFNMIWLSLIFFARDHASESFINSLATQPWIKPFSEYGYSIYMWQGISYSAAFELQKQYDFPLVLTWGVGVLGSILIARPFKGLESIRIEIDGKAT